jgi:hypothetical protein
MTSCLTAAQAVCNRCGQEDDDYDETHLHCDECKSRVCIEDTICCIKCDMKRCKTHMETYTVYRYDQDGPMCEDCVKSVILQGSDEYLISFETINQIKHLLL